MPAYIQLYESLSMTLMGITELNKFYLSIIKNENYVN